MFKCLGYADGAAAGMALPAHLYCLWGEVSPHTAQYPVHMSDVVDLSPRDHL